MGEALTGMFLRNKHIHGAGLRSTSAPSVCSYHILGPRHPAQLCIIGHVGLPHLSSHFLSGEAVLTPSNKKALLTASEWSSF